MLKNNYIRYIDGLRAIAVMLVFIFHLSPEFLPGGFIGVDIFFVLSGYLISGIIIERHTEKSFYRKFIISRILRLLPVYILVVAFTLVFSWYILLPNELITFSKSLIAASSFTSNIFFYLNSDYFAGNSEFFPLLHTWSLSVEWQFYLLFPFILAAILRLPKHYTPLILIFLIGICTAVTYFVSMYSPSLAFYNTPFRASEFLVGTLVYVLFKRRKLNRGISNSFWFQTIGWWCIVTLVLLSYLINEEHLFPGIYATIIALVTGAILYVGNSTTQENTWIKILSLKPIVYIGNISYSFYLWHWPIITFYKLYLQAPFGFFDYCIIVLLTFFLSDLSWRFVECRFRTNNPRNKKSVGWMFTLTCVFSATVFITVLSTKGVESRFTQQQLSILNIQKWADFPGECYATQVKERFYNCKIGDLSSEPELLVFGDSHAQVLVWSLDKLLKEKKGSAIIVAKGGCPPFMPGVPTITDIEKSICEDVQRTSFELALNNMGKIKTVLLAGRWIGYEKAELYGQDFSTGKMSSENFEYRLLQMISVFKRLSYDIVLFDSVPEPGFPVPETVVRAEIFGKKINGFESKKHTISDYIEKKSIKIIRPRLEVCSDSKCMYELDGQILYFDSNHLSIAGADLILEELTFLSDRNKISN
ncbi:acyltransferase family protein [Alteromonas sp. 1_MG-2023]|uniref:acyltransferase family protein n=1 Tax=Alteromonas sp. 1_MG-2023 TaxID=3062669 RepID=UPI0026E2ECD3|nr:acyltransferase family protein [Alteromonas sp. 1_MG-2023]MDO6566330.1 acyltransferase family protein [Alteromonas sp. 1_MG-2023]